MTFNLDWSNANIDGSNTLSSGGASVGVTISTPRNQDRDEWSVQNGQLYSNDVCQDTTVKMTFTSEVTNLSFTVYDVDKFDKIKIYAKDANGNLVPVTFESTGVHSVNGGTVVGLGYNQPGPGISNPGYDIDVTVAGPITELVIVHDDTGSSLSGGDSGAVALSDISFDLAGPEGDGIVQGTGGDDLIDYHYDGDPEGDMIDHGDAILPGESGDDDIVLAGAGDDIVKAGAGDDEVYGGSGSDTLYGGAGDDILIGDDSGPYGSGSSTTTEREVFKWSELDDKYGGSLQDGEKLVSQSLDTGANKVTFTTSASHDSTFSTDEQKVHSIDTGGLGGANSRSSLESDLNGYGKTLTYKLEFEKDAEDVSFRINDIDNDSTVVITAYDANGNKIAVDMSAGDGVWLKDQDGLAGYEKAVSKGGNSSDTSPHYSALVQIDGPVAKIVITHTQDGYYSSQVNVTDIYFDTVVTTGDTGLPGNDLIYGGEGDDYIEGNAGDDRLFGEEGNDEIHGGEGDDYINGGIGDDKLYGGTGNDEIWGGEGDDHIDGGAGDDLLEGGSGNDTILGGEGDDVIKGRGGNDHLYGGAGNDEIYGGYDNDYIEGGDGDDYIDAMSGDDVIYGGAGNDTIIGGGGDDFIDGGAGDDTIHGHNNRDIIYGGTGNDTIYAEASADEVYGGAGDDYIDGGEGDDILDGGTGDDVILGGGGNDTITGGDGNDHVEGGDGDDYINTSGNIHPLTGLSGSPDRGYPGIWAPDANPNDDKDVVYGGAGNDTIITGDDNDFIDGGDGDDYIDGGFDDDEIYGGAGNDIIIGGEGSDYIEGGDGDDVIYGGLHPDFPDVLNVPDDAGDLVTDNGKDIIHGGKGNDTIYGQDDDDLIYGGEGDDYLDGGVDDDEIYGGTGNDTIIGGEGADRLFGGDDRDTFIGGNGGDYVDGGDGGDDYDTLDLTGTDLDRIEYTSEDREDGIVHFKDGSTMEFVEIENVIPCFTPGTMIATPMGEVPVERLKAGDKIITRDNGIQEIRWVGHTLVDAVGLMKQPQMKPVRISRGALGAGLPERDMLVSPQHRVLVINERTALYFEEREVLVAAKHLVNGQDIVQVDVPSVTYIHFMFDQHEVVLSDGAWTESFQPGDYTLGGLGVAQREEILALFPELKEKQGREAYAAARKTLKKREALLLTE